jgi:hypothetical protein
LGCVKHFCQFLAWYFFGYVGFLDFKFTSIFALRKLLVRPLWFQGLLLGSGGFSSPAASLGRWKAF